MEFLLQNISETIQLSNKDLNIINPRRLIPGAGYCFLSGDKYKKPLWHSHIRDGFSDSTCFSLSLASLSAIASLSNFACKSLIRE
jgi:hypothetical protein